MLALYCTDPTKPKIILHPASHPKLTIDITTMKAIAIATNSSVVSNDEETAHLSANPESHEFPPTGRTIPSDGSEETATATAAVAAVRRDMNDRSRARTTALFRARTVIGDYAPRFTVRPVVHASPESRTISLTTPLVDASSPVPDPVPMLYRPFVRKHIDSTGTFHWVPSTPMSRVKLVSID
ncbi:unnamed protein product [Schistocephalus solidus]|uniref:Uncharacterized protein n=1 Tax=Schistocephalus solidus TaxID=70667 RepID=A0A3P7F0M0_SCHSO|nr:unnamed protein product [Schistocephalus solidus]